MGECKDLVEVEVEDKPKFSDKSPLVPIDDLVTALRTYRNPSLKSGNISQIREPEPFMGKTRGSNQNSREQVLGVAKSGQSLEKDRIAGNQV